MRCWSRSAAQIPSPHQSASDETEAKVHQSAPCQSLSAKWVSPWAYHIQGGMRSAPVISLLCTMSIYVHLCPVCPVCPGALQQFFAKLFIKAPQRLAPCAEPGKGHMSVSITVYTFTPLVTCSVLFIQDRSSTILCTKDCLLSKLPHSNTMFANDLWIPKLRLKSWCFLLVHSMISKKKSQIATEKSGNAPSFHVHRMLFSGYSRSHFVFSFSNRLLPTWMLRLLPFQRKPGSRPICSFYNFIILSARLLHFKSIIRTVPTKSALPQSSAWGSPSPPDAQLCDRLSPSQHWLRFIWRSCFSTLHWVTVSHGSCPTQKPTSTLSACIPSSQHEWFNVEQNNPGTLHAIIAICYISHITQLKHQCISTKL